MDCTMGKDFDRDAELAALARLVVYARESARVLGSKNIEAGLSVTLEAIMEELGGDVEIARLVTTRSATGRNYQ